MLKLEDLSELLAQHRDMGNARVAEFSIDGVRFDFNSRPSIMDTRMAFSARLRIT